MSTWQIRCSGQASNYGDGKSMKASLIKTDLGSHQLGHYAIKAAVWVTGRMRWPPLFPRLPPSPLLKLIVTCLCYGPYYMHSSRRL